MWDGLYYRPTHEIETSYFPDSQNIDDQLPFYCNTMVETHDNSYSTTSSNSILLQNASPIDISYIGEDSYDLNHKLLELETTMFGNDIDFLETYDSMGTKAISRGDLKSILIACAKAVSEDDFLTSQWLLSELRQMVSFLGEPMQRLGAYMLEGLQILIYKTPKREELENTKLTSYTQTLYEICPYFKFGYMSANGAIAKAMKDEKRVHIIDFKIGQGNQWITLIQAFGTRPGGPPHIRITGIDDSTELHAVGQRLCSLAESCNVPFEFYGASISATHIRLGNLEIRPGEALAANFAFLLNHVPDESVCIQNHRDRILRLTKSLSPKVVTLVEQEAKTNSSLFLPRFEEVLDYYHAMFESIDVALPREHKDRTNVEQQCLARRVVNSITDEGIERHENFEKWKSRFSAVGFKPYPLSSSVNATIETLLKNYCSRYRLEERDGALYLGWMDKTLVTSSAWK